ncbi:hypothetical protein HPG69_009395 [Diceros bicornis minor]|uniref:Uncharacterized protein n=1 Tax=Diceros bicornis minor TaxID=77932 RepID=A0A7J7F2U3_DICBM|nr:hypothetical protein HPG69_009395 [Diceros bicornis minor]
MFAILDRTVTTKIKGTWVDLRESNKIWFKPPEHVPPGPEYTDAEAQSDDLEANEIMTHDVGVKHLHRCKDDAECRAGPRSGNQCPGPLLSLSGLFTAPHVHVSFQFKHHCLAVESTRNRRERLDKRD